MIFREWPIGIKCPVTTSWFLKSTTTSSGRGLDGREQVISRENRFWTASLTVPKIWKKDIPKWYAFVDSLRGRAVPFRIPVCNPYAPKSGDRFLGSIGIDQSAIDAGCLPFSDGKRFSDDNGFSLPEYEDVTVTGAGVPAGSSCLSVSRGMAPYLENGIYFDSDDHLYRIERRDRNKVYFNPPLRAPIALGETLEIEYPHILVRLASDDDARLVQTASRRGVPVTFNVEEAFER